MPYLRACILGQAEIGLLSQLNTAPWAADDTSLT